MPSIIPFSPIGPFTSFSTGSCSIYGICLTTASSSSSSTAYNTAPSISLVTTASAPTTTSIKQGYSYAACGLGQQPAAGAECELGATAKDAQSGDLTAAVLVCAPSPCTAASCVASEISSHSHDVHLASNICSKLCSALTGYTACQGLCVYITDCLSMLLNSHMSACVHTVWLASEVRSLEALMWCT